MVQTLESPLQSFVICLHLLLLRHQLFQSEWWSSSVSIPHLGRGEVRWAGKTFSLDWGRISLGLAISKCCYQTLSSFWFSDTWFLDLCLFLLPFGFPERHVCLVPMSPSLVQNKTNPAFFRGLMAPSGSKTGRRSQVRPIRATVIVSEMNGSHDQAKPGPFLELLGKEMLNFLGKRCSFFRVAKLGWGVAECCWCPSLPTAHEEPA